MLAAAPVFTINMVTNETSVKSADTCKKKSSLISENHGDQKDIKLSPLAKSLRRYIICALENETDVHD